MYTARCRLTLGPATGFAGVNLSNTFSDRLQPNEVKASSTAGTAFDLIYCFNAWNTGTNACSTTTGSNNGNVNGITNNLDGNRSQFFSYDQLNRILTGQTVATYSASSAKCWGESYVYDTPGGGAWGNLVQINVAATTYNGCTQESLNVGVSASNQLTATGYSYDASGNMLTDSRNTYTFNAESEITSAASVNYTYDGDGNRVEKSNGKIYWYGAGTEILDESDASGNISNEYIFFGGKRVALRTVSSGTITYYAEDFLGTSRVILTSTGTVCYDADFYPFGGERAYTNTCSQNYKFEGKERDTETNNDDFGARYYASTIGRWLSPDWSSTAVAVPYANLNNPQTLNLYAMVHDNPETFADLDGHCYPLCTVVVGAVVGAVTGGGAEFIAEKVTGQPTNWSKIGNAAAGGAVTGAITGLAGPEAGLAAKAGTAVIASVTGGGTERALNGEKVVDPKAIAMDAAAGLISAGIEAGGEKLIAKPDPLKEVSKSDTKSIFVPKSDSQIATETTARNVTRTAVDTAAGTAADAGKRSQEEKKDPAKKIEHD